MPATPWVAVYSATRPGTQEDFRKELPLVGWALVPPLSSIRPGMRPGEHRLVGMVVNGRSIELVDETAADFMGYELPLGERHRADLDADDAETEWNRRFLTKLDD